MISKLARFLASPREVERLARLASRSVVCAHKGKLMATTGCSSTTGGRRQENHKEALGSYQVLMERSFSSSPSPTPLCDSSDSREAIDEANSRVDAKVEIKETEDGRGWGLYSKKDLRKGELVFRGAALATTSARTTHTVQLDWDKHVTMDMPATLVNHSCDANVGIKENELGAYDFFALRDIPMNTEVLWDYETAESEIANFQCSCGADRCRGFLQGFKTHGKEVSKAYGTEYVAPYLLRQ